MTQTTNKRTTTWTRVRPRIWIGLLIFLGYVALVTVVGRVSGVDYDELGDNAANLFQGAGISLILGAVVLAVTTTWLGWWRPALFERKRSVRWPIITPVLLATAMLFNLIGSDWDSYDGAFFAASLVLLLVGFTEEMATRGLLLTGLRSSLHEAWVWLITSTLFALMHLINIFLGQPIAPTLQQVLFAFMAGTVLYILRRVTGTLLWSMVLHALWTSPPSRWDTVRRTSSLDSACSSRFPLSSLRSSPWRSSSGVPKNERDPHPDGPQRPTSSTSDKPVRT